MERKLTTESGISETRKFIKYIQGLNERQPESERNGASEPTNKSERRLTCSAAAGGFPVGKVLKVGVNLIIEGLLLANEKRRQLGR